MKYALLVYSPENSWTPEEWTACVAESTAICRELQAKGEFLAASPLHPVATATSIRVRQGKTIVTTGPFAETVEQLGGFFLIDVSDLDDAVAVAERLPAAKKGTVEIRPVLILKELPHDRFDLVQTATDGQRSPYMLLCYDDEQTWTSLGQAAHASAIAEAIQLVQRLAARGQFASASPLQSSETATSVRIREGRRLISDGPFAETREVLGGYYLVLARDLNEAIAIAAQHPGAPHGTVEIRQLFAEAAVV